MRALHKNELTFQDFLLRRDVCQSDLLFLDQRKREADLQNLVVLKITTNMEDARTKSGTSQIRTKNVTTGCKMPCSMKKPNTDVYSVTALKKCGSKKRGNRSRRSSTNGGLDDSGRSMKRP